MVTATGPDGKAAGMAVGSFFSVSLEPPLVGFCAGKSSTSYPSIEAAGQFAVNVLGADQEGACRNFANKGGDKFDGIAHHPSPVTGSPVLDGVHAWLDCTIEVVHEAGDHWIVVGRVHDLGRHDGLPIVFYRGEFGGFSTSE